ncbi:MAG TPA: EthD domain-containing protein [Novosphingobium sp.]|nr:EthD domain-containing protein [Novosphingobium sp.]
MIKALFFLKRKAGISHEQFREHFETSHAHLAHEHFGHLMIGYQRNYPSQVRLGATHAAQQDVDYDVDCVSEWFLADEEALEKIFAILSSPDIGPIFREDEAKFLDVSKTVVIRFHEGDVVDTGTDGEGGNRIVLPA